MAASKKRWLKSLAFLLLGVASIVALRFLAARLGEKDEDVSVPGRIAGSEDPAEGRESLRGREDRPAGGKEDSGIPTAGAKPDRRGDEEGAAKTGRWGALYERVKELKAQGEFLLFRSSLAPTEIERDALREKAGTLIEEARALLKPVEENLTLVRAEKGLAAFPASRFALLRDVQFDFAEILYFLGLACVKDREKRITLLLKAINRFTDFIWNFEDSLLGWLAYLRQARCYMAMREYGKAIDLCRLVLSIHGPAERKSQSLDEDSPLRRARDGLVIQAMSLIVENLVQARKYVDAIEVAVTLEGWYPRGTADASPHPTAARMAVLEKAKALAGLKKLPEAIEEVLRVIALGGTTAILGRRLLDVWSIAYPALGEEDPEQIWLTEWESDWRASRREWPPDSWSVWPKPGSALGDRKAAATSGGKKASAVRGALDWLARHQNPDGTWSCRKFMMNCKKGTCTGPGGSDDYDTGVTALALLAFLGAGNTHKEGPHRGVVLKGVRALLDRQTPDGCFGPKTARGHWIYNHILAAQAVAEDYGWAGGAPILKEPAQKGVDFLVDCQNPYLGWRYGRQTGENDSSVTGCAVLALKTAKLCGLHVPKECFDGALNWFRKVTDESTFETGYTAKGSSGARLLVSMDRFPTQPAMTAIAVTSRIFILESKASDRPQVLGGGNVVSYRPPEWDTASGTIDMYYWYWGSLALHQLGGPSWEPWQASVEQALLAAQETEGCGAGSWDPVGAWGPAGGRVYATAICALTLETAGRYGRMLEKK